MQNYNFKSIRIISMHSYISIAILFSIFYSLFFILGAQAADTGGLVPCTGLDCKFCGLTELVGRVINFALKDIALPLVAIMIVWGGFVIMTAGDDSGKVGEGRKIIQAAAIGLVVALGAWVIITEFLSIFIGNGFIFDPWDFGNYADKIC